MFLQNSLVIELEVKIHVFSKAANTFTKLVDRVAGS